MPAGKPAERKSIACNVKTFSPQRHGGHRGRPRVLIGDCKNVAGQKGSFASLRMTNLTAEGGCATRQARPRYLSTFSTGLPRAGNAQTSPWEKPALPMSNTRLKRAR